MDLAHAFGWYEEQLAGLGTDFLEEITAALNRVQVQPLAYPQVEGNIRRSFARRFPYAVYFLVEADICVLAVLHQKRNPRAWQGRNRSS